MLKLASIFTDSAVLQRNKLIPVWGQATPQKLVEITLGKQKSWAKATAAGKFMSYMPAQTAGGPYELTVKCEDETITLRDIMIGEVWLAGGQSNMSYTLASDLTNESSRPIGLNKAQLEEYLDTLIEKKAFRMFTVPRIITATAEEEINAKWEQASKKNPDITGSFSAVAAWFARYIQEGLEDIPVGIISSNWGGSIAETWTSTASLLRNPLTRAGALGHITGYSEYDNIAHSHSQKSTEENLAKMIDLDDFFATNKGLEEGWAETDFIDSNWKPLTIPGSWLRQKFANNGIIWVRIPVNIPKNWEGKELILHLGGIDKTDITYFNGTEIGRMGEKLDVTVYATQRRYTVPTDLIKTGHNVIAIRAVSFAYDGSFNGSELFYYLECPELQEKIELAGTYKAAVEKDIGLICPPANMYPDLNNHNVPGALFDSMINPLLPYAIRGAIWYQGESNAHAPREYESILENMINDWRFHFQQGDFPFIQVQLANYREPASFDKNSSWALLRDSQDKLCRRMKNVYMSTAIDIGDTWDIHPQDKKTIGKRLADNALCNVYGKNCVVPNGPLLRKAVRENDAAVRLIFDYADGIYFPNGSPESLGFFICDEKNVFTPVDNVILDGNSLIVSCKAIKNPVKVCYSWSDNPDGNLRNGAGLPAHPFMVDTEY